MKITYNLFSNHLTNRPQVINSRKRGLDEGPENWNVKLLHLLIEKNYYRFKRRKYQLSKQWLKAHSENKIDQSGEPLIFYLICCINPVPCVFVSILPFIKFMSQLITRVKTTTGLKLSCFFSLSCYSFRDLLETMCDKNEKHGLWYLRLVKIL